MAEKILIIDFGSQYTQLIARKVRACNVYCEIHPCLKPVSLDSDIKGVILSGSPFSVMDPKAPKLDVRPLLEKVPVLGVCYGAQLVAQAFGGEVARGRHREYGRARINHNPEALLFKGMSEGSQVWMSHGDSVISLPEGFETVATTDTIPIAAFACEKICENPFYGLQFHPEVYHSTEGLVLLENFLVRICNCVQDWTPEAFVCETVNSIREIVGHQRVIMALSGGVDSTVAASLIQAAVGNQLTAVFVDNGLLRKDEYRQVLDSYMNMGLNVIGVDARERFYDALYGVSDPEKKRKIIGNLFITIFQEKANKIKGTGFLGQGTIYPDVIESISVNGPSATIKSHHNVGGLPEKMNLKLIEPLRNLFKDEVRKIGKEIDVSEAFLKRHPFPGPGLGIRILGSVTAEKVKLLQEADAIFINMLRERGLYDEVWQAGAILLPVQSVGVMGDERTYEYTVALRAVASTDGMTADWVHLPYTFLAEVSNTIINQVEGINRVVYDISSKPPATIEWE